MRKKTNGIDSDDISGGQSTGNYTYDLIGNLISDNAEGINNITWNVYGKISSIDKASGPDLTFAYDPMGNRIMKLVDDGSALIYTYYLRDAQGNVLSTYSRIDDASDDIITLSELHIYGSSRLGIMVEDLDMSTTITSNGHSQRNLGKKRYELNNHLGNVLTVITDRRFGTEQGTTGLIKYYEADVLQAQDYYPFGMLTPGRNWSAGSEYRFGFNGKESDAETYGDGNAYDFGARIYDPRLGRWMSVDPLASQYPGWNPFNFALINPIRLIDKDGLAPDDFYFNQQGTVIKRVTTNTTHKFYAQTGSTLTLANTQDGVGLGLGSVQPTLFVKSPTFTEIKLNSDFGYLARAVFTEAEGESSTSKQVVAETIRNRLLLPNEHGFGNSIKNIVDNPQQFEIAKNGNPQKAKFLDPLAYIGNNPIKLNAFTDAIGSSLNVVNNRTNIAGGATFFTGRGQEGFKSSRVSNVPIPNGATGFGSLRKLNDRTINLNDSPSFQELNK